MKRNFHLGQGDFDSLLGLLSNDRDEAGEAYERLRRGLFRFFRYKGCPDAEDLVDETFNRVAVRSHKFDPSLHHNPERYFYGFAALIAKEYKRKAALLKPLNGSEPNGNGFPSNGSYPESQLLDLQICLERLNDADRSFITEYYSLSGQARIDLRDRMCERLNCTATTLYVRASRIRKKLAQCMEDCGKK